MLCCVKSQVCLLFHYVCEKEIKEALLACFAPSEVDFTVIFIRGHHHTNRKTKNILF